MSDEMKNQEGNQESCCKKSSCCCGKKLIIGLILGFLLFSTGYLLGKSNLCAGKVCPFSKMQVQQ